MRRRSASAKLSRAWRTSELGVPAYAKKTIESVQRVRNRIEHHTYDHSAEDEAIIGQLLKFIMYFVEFVLHRKLEGQIDDETLREIIRLKFDYDERCGLAESRLHEWLRTVWPDWKGEEGDAAFGSRTNASTAPSSSSSADPSRRGRAMVSARCC